MGDPRKLAYLDALGVESYVPRGSRPVEAVAAEVAPVAIVTAATAEPPGLVSSLDWEALRTRVAACTLCELHSTRTQTVFGVGNPRARWMFIGEAPGAEEDRQGEPFVGRAGQLLTSMLKALGFSRDDVFIANVLKCRPPGNRTPVPVEVDACRPYLWRQIELLRPKVICTLGNFATKLLLDTKTGITKLRGHEYPWKDAEGNEVVLIPTLHPSAVLRSGGVSLAQSRADFVLVKRALQRVGGS